MMMMMMMIIIIIIIIIALSVPLLRYSFGIMNCSLEKMKTSI